MKIRSTAEDLAKLGEKGAVTVVVEGCDLEVDFLQEPELVHKYGFTVWADKEMDELRRHRCLCLRCAKVDLCSVARKLLEMCKEHNLALAMTRCKEWAPKL